MYKFCKANGGWWFVCRSIEELFDFKDKNSNKFALKITFLHIPQELRIRSRGTERHSASN